MKWIAKTVQGLEAVLAEELQELGAEAVEPLIRAVSFEGGQELMYRANLELRTALRILTPIHSFRCKTEK
jgi:putative N6-adenine-specific DNA methylase